MARPLSAGILLYRRAAGRLQVFLVHPGGPYWRNKDDGAWSVPKGLAEAGEDPLGAARREFAEETGFEPEGEVVSLGAFRQPSGKTVVVWAMKGDCDPAALVSNTFRTVWPPRSGKSVEFPEVDRAAWFDIDTARRKIVKGQRGIVDALEDALGS